MAQAAEKFARAHLLAFAFASYSLGIIATAQAVSLQLAAGVACAGALVVAAALSPRSALARLVFASACLGALGALAAVAARNNNERTRVDAYDGRHVVCRAVALERPRPSPSGLAARVAIDRCTSNGVVARSLNAPIHGMTALLEMPADGSVPPLAGRIVQIRARLDAPSGARNDGEPAERDTLNDQGISFILSAHRTSDVYASGVAPGWSAWWARARARFAEAVETRLPPLDATVLEGVLWGDRGNLPASLRQEFADTGTVHVLTTAGLHLGIMAALIAGFCTLTPLPRPARAAIVVAAGWVYAILAGLHVPTERAATMLTAGTVAYELGRGRTPSAVLGAAAFAVVLPHPLVLLAPSFSMSFACVCGIALLGPAFARLGLSAGEWGPHWLAELVRTNLAVQIALWPLQALYFNAFTPYAVLANLAVVPLVGFVMAFGSAYAAAALAFPLLAPPFANLTEWCLTVLVGIVDRFATLPCAHVDVPPPSHGFLMLYWLALAAFAWAVHAGLPVKRIARHGCAVIAALAFVFVIPGIQAALDPRLHLDALDVGQADCLLVRAPGMHAMLVDGGGRLERAGNAVVAQPIGDRIATRTVMPFLLRHWVLHLDAVVLTHPHGDHAGGLPTILSREQVGALYDSAQLYSGPAYQRALDVVRQRRIRWIRAERGVAFDLGPATHVQILAPERPLIVGTSSDINNNSVVLRVTFGHVGLLLTGDAQSEAEARLLSHGRAPLRADILKVGHHGSAYSSTPEFLAAVHPKIAIISCGRHNLFGHPSPRTISALTAAGSAIFRTDNDGGVSVSTDGNAVVVASHM